MPKIELDQGALEAAAIVKIALELHLDQEDPNDHLAYLEGWDFHVEFCRRIIEAYEEVKLHTSAHS